MGAAVCSFFISFVNNTSQKMKFLAGAVACFVPKFILVMGVGDEMFFLTRLHEAKVLLT